MNKLSKFTNPTIIKLLLGSILYDAVLIVSYANILVQQIGKTAAIITTALIIKKVIRTFLDVPTGIFVDKHLTPKKSVIISIIIKIIFISLLAFNSITALLLSSLLEGLSLSFFRGKSGVLQYEIFEKEGMKSHFEFFSSIYGLLTNITTTVMGLISVIAFKIGGMKYVFQGSIVGLLISLTLISLLPETHKKTQKQQSATSGQVQSTKKPKGRSLTLKATKRTLIATIKLASPVIILNQIKSIPSKAKEITAKTGKKAIYLSTICGVSSLAWQANAMNQFLAIHLLHNPFASSKIFQIGTAAASIGCLVSMPFKNIKAHKLGLITMYGMFAAGIISAIAKPQYAIFAIVPYLLTFNISEIGSRKLIIQEAEAGRRSSAMSISTTITSILSTATMFLFQTLGSKFGYQKTFSCIFVSLGVISIAPVVGLLRLQAKSVKRG